MEKEYLTTAEAAEKLGISRVAVFQRIKAGTLKAERFGRSFAIPKSEIVEKADFSEKDKKTIEKAVRKTVEEYGVALKMLGRE